MQSPSPFIRATSIHDKIATYFPKNTISISISPLVTQPALLRELIYK